MVAHSSNVAIENEIGKSSFRHIGKSDVEKDVLNLTQLRISKTLKATN